MKITLFFLVLISSTAIAQVKLPTSETGQVQYQEIVRVGDGKGPARPLFDQIRAWAKKRYPLAREAELQNDPQHGIVFVRSLYTLDDQSIRYTLTIEAKIGRYRATLTDLVADQGGFLQPVRPVSSSIEDLERVAADSVRNSSLIEQAVTRQSDIYKQIDDACRTTLASLKQSLTVPIAKQD